MTEIASFSMPIAVNQTSGEGNDKWIHLLPSGTFAGRDGRGPYHVDDAAKVIDQSRMIAGTRQIPIDYEHQIDLAAQNGQPAPAAGWIDAMQSRPDGIWGRVKWTPRAAEYLAAQEYRYFSPTIMHTPEGSVLSIVRGALTNFPNLPQLVALARAETPKMDPTSDPTTLNAFLSSICRLLGLPDGSSPASALSALQDMLTDRNAATPDPAKFVPIGVFEEAVAQVNRLNQGISLQSATMHVDHQIRSGNLPPSLKAWGISLCTTNKVAFDGFIERTGKWFNRIVDPYPFDQKFLSSHNRMLTEEEQKVCSRMGVSEEEFLKARSFNEQTKA